MATRGRKPKPTPLKILEGTQRGAPKREPSAPTGAPTMPKRLNVEPLAVEKWNELVPVLLGMNVLTTGDGEALATLCEVYAAAQACLLELRATGPVMKTDLGGIKPNPAGPLYKGLVSLQTSLMTEFGLTPSSRVRLGTKQEQPADELADFFARHQGG
ncbi:MAG: phage terminase small subunit P27 family [Caulobacteraceae bacterium]|nr:phage terminase small subunit P27 family [Caulobacteraceae bacterium]